MQAWLSSALDVKQEKLCVYLTSTQTSSNIGEIIDNTVTVVQLWTDVGYPVLAVNQWDNSAILMETVLLRSIPSLRCAYDSHCK